MKSSRQSNHIGRMIGGESDLKKTSYKTVYTSLPYLSHIELNNKAVLHLQYSPSVSEKKKHLVFDVPGMY